MCHKNFLQCCICFTIIFSFTLSAQEWELLGLKEHKVFSILLQDNFMLAGTDTGIYSAMNPVTNPTFYKVGNEGDGAFNLPAYDMKISGSIEAIAALSDGTRSDAVYLLERIIKGPPYYAASRIDYFLDVSALAVTKENGILPDTLYAGSGNSIQMSIRSGDLVKPVFSSFQELRIPQGAFGVEMPYCAAMECWPYNNMLFAGGYDKSPEPGPGHLLWNQKDSLRILRKLNVTAIVCGETGDVIMRNVFFATRDSGIWHTNVVMSSPPVFLCESPGKEAINDLYMVNGNFAKPAKFYCAVKSGVYTNGSGVLWVKLGKLPVQPLCVYHITRANTLQDSILFAGTENGIYVYKFPSTSLKNNYSKTNSDITITNRQNNTVEVSYSISSPQQLKLELFDCKGRYIKTLANKYMSEGTHLIVLKRDSKLHKMAFNNLLFLRMKTNDIVSVKKLLLTSIR